MKLLAPFSGKNLQALTQNLLTISDQQIAVQDILNEYHNYLIQLRQENKNNITKSLAKYLNWNVSDADLHFMMNSNEQNQNSKVLIITSYIQTLETIYQYRDHPMSIMLLLMELQQRIGNLDNHNQADFQSYNTDLYYTLQKKLDKIYTQQNSGHKIKNIFTIYDILNQYYSNHNTPKYQDLCLVLLLRFLLTQSEYQYTDLINFEGIISMIIKTCNHKIINKKIYDDQHDIYNLPNINCLLTCISDSYKNSIILINDFSTKVIDTQHKIINTIKKLNKRFTMMDLYLIHKDVDTSIINQTILQEMERGNLRSEIISNHANYFHVNTKKNFSWGCKMKQIKEIIMQKNKIFTFQDLLYQCPNVSAISIRKTLTKCSEAGLITCKQKGRNAHWVRNKKKKIAL